MSAVQEAKVTTAFRKVWEVYEGSDGTTVAIFDTLTLAQEYAARENKHLEDSGYWQHPVRHYGVSESGTPLYDSLPDEGPYG